MRPIKNPTELIGIKDIKRLGFGFRNFINFRKRVFITLNIQKEKTYQVLSRC